MRWYKRLRWRLIGSQFLVAVVGVTVMIIATQMIIINPAPRIIRAQLSQLLENPAQIAQTEALLLLDFRNAVFASVAFAAIAAVIAGVGSSIIIWRTLILPLRTVAQRSQRIADGRYGERVDVPTNSGEAMIKLVTSFNQMTESLEQIEQQRVALLGNISHELRTPLTGLNGYVEGLSDGLFEPSEETFAWMMEEIQRLSRLVDDIHSLSRIEAGQFSLDLRPFALQPIINRIVTQISPQLKEKKVSLNTQSENGPITLSADKDRTAQILINLMSNAVRYTPENGNIWLTVKTKANQAIIIVKDDGIGIPTDALPYLFERFYRVDQSRARATGGSGIGLTISRHLAWAMGGNITAHSDGSNKGSAFVLTLPLSQ